MFGTPLEAAQLLLPRGSKLLSTSQESVPTPSRQTPVGLVDLPPKTYYRYEFTTPNGLHVCMAAGAQRGRIFVLGASAPGDKWADVAGKLRRAALTFRMKDGSVLL